MRLVLLLAPPLRDVLLAPRERVLWPMLILVGLFALWGLLIRRHQRGKPTAASHGSGGNDKDAAGARATSSEDSAN